jgi:hypothetical protein
VLSLVVSFDSVVLVRIPVLVQASFVLLDFPNASNDSVDEKHLPLDGGSRSRAYLAVLQAVLAAHHKDPNPAASQAAYAALAALDRAHFADVSAARAARTPALEAAALASAKAVDAAASPSQNASVAAAHAAHDLDSAELTARNLVETPSTAVFAFKEVGIQ